MSQIGKKEIVIPENVTADFSNNTFSAKGALGELSYKVMDGISVSINDNTISVSRADDSKSLKELHGLTRSLLFNIIEGVSNGFQKELNLVGVGYTADASNNDYLLLNLGYSHPIYFQKPNTITFEKIELNKNIFDKPSILKIVDKGKLKLKELIGPEHLDSKGRLPGDPHYNHSH